MNGDLDPVVWFIISTAGKDPSKSTPLALFGVGSNHDATFASSEFWLSDSLLKYCMERILARYERCSYAESLANPTANPTDQESAGSWSLEYVKLKARIEFLEKSKRHYMGEDIDSLSLKELQNLEHQIDSSMKHIRSRKDRALKDENNKLAKKIKEREKEMAEQPNLEQQEKQDTNSSSSYVPSQPINSFNLGETYEAAGEDREIEDAPAAQPPPPPNIVMPQWLLPHLTGG
nr:agamous-like MADS-box protein AGL8 homolog [Ipomoea batatas]